jgi:hypothetical protein
MPNDCKGTHKTATNESGSVVDDSVIEAGVDRVMTAFRYSCSAGPKPHRDAAEKNLKREVFSRPEEPRTKPIEDVMKLLRGAFLREKSEADLLAFPDAIRNEIELWFLNERDTTPENFDLAHLDETMAESDTNNAEARYRLERSWPALQEMKHKNRVHQLKADRQIKVAEMELRALA